MRTRILLPIFLAIILITAACGSDDESDGEEEHECLISADLVRVEFDFEELWDAELIAQIIEGSLPPIFPDEFLELLPDPPPFGTIYVPEEASGFGVSFAVLPDGSVYVSEGAEFQPQGGMLDLLSNVELRDGLGEGLVPTGSIDPYGQVLPDDAVWSSDGSIVELEYDDTRYRYEELIPSTDVASLIGEVNSALVDHGAALDSGGKLLSVVELVERVGPTTGSQHFLPATSYAQLVEGSVASVSDVVNSTKTVGDDVVGAASSSLIAKVTGYFDETLGELEWDWAVLRDHLASQGGVDVEPIYALAFEGHWSLEPGAEAFQPVAEDSNDYASAESAVSSLKASLSPEASAPIVAIVDSGFPKEGWPGLDVGLADYDRKDTLGKPSHGLFVASLIRQLAPDARVIGVRADVLSRRIVSTDGSVFEQMDDGSGVYRFQDHVSGEIAVLTDEDMVIRALNRLENHLDADAPDIINLSMGTYACPDSSGIDPPLAIQTRIQNSWPRAVVYAAAGNEALSFEGHHGSNFYPAAFEKITGVAATDTDGNLWTWDEDKQRVEALPDSEQPDSVDMQALGIDVVGVAGAEIGVWSGSSFATAVASGLAARSAEASAAALKCPAGITHGVPKLDGQELATDEGGKRIYDDFKSCQN